MAAAVAGHRSIRWQRENESRWPGIRRDLHALLTKGTTVAYNKDQWISSFEDQLTILRPHLTSRVLETMSLAAWHSHGRKNEDPIQAAQEESKALDRAHDKKGS
jgi:hypothetical protein